MYKVFVLNRPIYFVASTNEIKKQTDSLIKPVDSADELYKELMAFENSAFDSAWFITSKLDDMWQNFRNIYKIIHAAGGIVYNENQECLWIYRRGYWDLPKGKVEKGESYRMAALREVGEECGITKHSIEKHIIDTYHTYVLKNKKILKCTHWFKMHCSEDEELTPQQVEDITLAEWVRLEDSGEQLSKTYESIKDVITAVEG